MIQIKIVKHEDPRPITETGDILKPFSTWRETKTGAKWYSKVTHDIYKEVPYLPLSALCPNSWEALKQLNISFHEFRDLVQYKCPYNGYVNFWAIPLHLFTDDLEFWVDRGKVRRKEIYLDQELMRHSFPSSDKNGFRFTSVQRSLMGIGYTETTMIQDGLGHLHDALIQLDNGDFLGSKIWVWYNK